MVSSLSGRGSKIRDCIMPGNKLLENFLIPSLENETFSHLLSWVKKEKGIFKLFCQHKNSSDWEEEDFAVFKRHMPARQR
ncbi:hypothetical protein HNY73_015382 [Argiope bruennichi]|uniref:IRF tryptophan pentad repeat domain-containing protein n=1 Tax=Argiope bruennichi TaxID=94029 RepID=A0A8T0ERW8_ARGBR|nr:hypothetical protein HNY73_015382 [Argiope bruennichi]